MTQLGDIIMSVYTKEKYNSFLPNHQRFIKSAYTYTADVIESENIKTIDKNKAYSHALKELDYIITCDFRQSRIIKKPRVIVPHYLYIVEPKQSSLLLPHLTPPEIPTYKR